MYGLGWLFLLPPHIEAPHKITCLAEFNLNYYPSPYEREIWHNQKAKIENIKKSDRSTSMGNKFYKY